MGTDTGTQARTKTSRYEDTTAPTGLFHFLSLENLIAEFYLVDRGLGFIFYSLENKRPDLNYTRDSQYFIAH